MAAHFRRSFRSGDFVAFAMLWLLVAVMSPQRTEAAPFAAVVMDARSGEILHSVNDRTRLHPASLTKMMTLYVAFEAVQRGEISLDTQITVSRRAAAEVPSRLGLRAGQRIALRYLIRGAALRSGNDAATAIAEGIEGSVEAFAARMNRTAAAIGMTQTTFRNAHGLTQAGHLSSARDMAILSRQIFFDYPQYYNLFSRRSEHAGVGHVRNTNWRFLDGYRGADGIKTGFTRAAGYNLAASAERGGKRIIVVVFGGRSTIDRHQRIVELMDRGFRQAPAQVAVRRPSPPDYSRTPPAVVAEGPSGSGQSAARVVRMQPAPSRSLIPQRRPGADLPDVPEELIASLQNSINEALSSANQPVEEMIVTEEAVQLALTAAPDRSLAPTPRPETSNAPTTEVAAEMAEEDETELASAEAAGFQVIDADTFAALTDPQEGPAELAQEAHAGNEVQLETELAAAGAEPRPDLAAPDVESDAIDAVVAEASDTAGTPLPEPSELASLTATAPADLSAAMPEEAAAAQILWRNEAPLAEVASRAATATEGLILLTTADTVDADPEIAGRSAIPEVVTRVSTSGGRVWSIDLGLHPSRFDAERVAIRAALAETAILSTGLRRVSPRSGRFAAGIYSLTEEEAEIACLRLSARGHACEVVHP